MATNPNVNKVIYGNQTVMDISDTTAEAGDVRSGQVFYTRSGAQATGTAIGGIPEEELRDTVGWTGKNLLEFSSSAVTQVIDGVTFTVSRNSSGEVTEVDANGTASANVSFSIKEGAASELSFANGKILSGCSGGSNSTYFQEIVMSDSPYTQYAKQTDDEITVSGVPSDSTALKIRIWVKSGTVLEHVKFYPMLRHASISDSTFEPYHESVKQVLRDSEVIEGKNLLKYPYKETTETVDGITFTVYNDGTIKANGTATDVASFKFFTLEKYNYGKPIIMSGCPSGGASDTYKLRFWDADNATSYEDYGSGVDIPDCNGHRISAFITINSGVTVSNLIFKPMFRYATESADYEPFYFPLKDGKVGRNEQRILGAKNYIDKLTVVPYNSSITQTDEGVRVQVNNAVSGSFFTERMILEPYTDYTITTYAHITSSSAKMRILVSGVKNNNWQTITYTDWTTTSGVITCTFNSGAYTPIRIWFYATDSAATADVTFENIMMRLASDPDNTYAPHAKTNEELTEREQVVIRKNVTASAGDSVRIPASGTDSRIVNDTNYIITPICDPKYVSGLYVPYKFRSIGIYDGYVTITMGEAISNLTIGVKINKYYKNNQ